MNMLKIVDSFDRWCCQAQGENPSDSSLLGCRFRPAEKAALSACMVQWQWSIWQKLSRMKSGLG